MVRLRGRQITAGLDCGPGLPIILPSSWEDLVLTIDSKDGSFKILHGNREAINIFAPGDSIYHHNYNSSVKLQDSGNLVLRELNPDGSRKQVGTCFFRYRQQMVEVGLVIFVPLFLCFCYMIWFNFRHRDDLKINLKSLFGIIQETMLPKGSKGASQRHKHDETELQMFNFETVAAATDYFSETNKLGEGGFGPVYKGKLMSGQEIAIKDYQEVHDKDLQSSEMKLFLLLSYNTLA
ncbi:G-type lectin S-receptor-like serine/threonine-protein kinase At1g67520 [Linum grandiflorum]